MPAQILLGRETQKRFPLGIPLWFLWYLGITSARIFVGIYRRRLGTNLFWRPFGSLLGFAIPRDSFSGIPTCFPPLGFTLIVSFARNSILPRRGFTVLLLYWGTTYNHRYKLNMMDSMVTAISQYRPLTKVIFSSPEIFGNILNIFWSGIKTPKISI